MTRVTDARQLGDGYYKYLNNSLLMELSFPCFLSLYLQSQQTFNL
jgi:hypothetical protein